MEPDGWAALEAGLLCLLCWDVPDGDRMQSPLEPWPHGTLHIQLRNADLQFSSGCVRKREDTGGIHSNSMFKNYIGLDGFSMLPLQHLTQ